MKYAPITPETRAEAVARHLPVAREIARADHPTAAPHLIEGVALAHAELMVSRERSRSVSFDGARISKAEAHELRGLGVL